MYDNFLVMMNGNCNNLI